MAVAGAEAAAGGPLSLDEVRALAREHNLIPLAQTFIDDCQTPVSAFLKLREEGPCFLLESAEQGRWGATRSLASSRARCCAGRSAIRETPTRSPPTSSPLPPRPADGAAAVRRGAVGMFAYDLVRTVEPLGEPNPDSLGLPDLALMLTDAIVAFDHLKHTVTVLANVYADDETDLAASYAQAQETIAEIRWRLAGPVPRPARPPAGAPRARVRAQHDSRAVRVKRRAHHRLHPGRRRLPGGAVPALVGAVPIEAFSIYRGLRVVNPSPYMYFLDFGDFEVAGASPEPLITVTGGVSPRARSPARGRAAPARGASRSPRVCSLTPRSAPSM